jgi:hypothetical protein
MGHYVGDAVCFHEEETEFLKPLSTISTSLLFFTVMPWMGQLNHRQSESSRQMTEQDSARLYPEEAC